jgi:hypothetical protein
MGPSTTRQGLDRVFDIVNKTVAEGAELALGGGVPDGFEKGFWMEPTVLLNATPDMTAFREEIFGPVMPVAKIDSWDEALAEIAERWQQIIAEYGPEAILPYSYSGTLGLVQGLAVVRDLHAEDVGRVEQPLGVFPQTEDSRAFLGPIGPHTPEHAHTVMQGVGEHMGLRLAPGHHLAV